MAHLLGERRFLLWVGSRLRSVTLKLASLWNYRGTWKERTLSATHTPRAAPQRDSPGRLLLKAYQPSR